MSFVKLDTGILRSTIWIDRDARDVFITALLLAEPREFAQPVAQIEVRSLEPTGWAAPAGWYGLVAAAGIGIINAAGVEREAGLNALERLGSPEADSRSRAHDGRRLIRIDGGYLVLNFMVYRDKDHTAADRARKYRERQAALRHGVTSRDANVTSRDRTQAEAEAEAEAGKIERGAGAPTPTKAAPKNRRWTRAPKDWQPKAEHRKIAAEEGKDFDRELAKFRDHEFPKPKSDADAAFRNWLRQSFGANGGRRNGRPVQTGPVDETAARDLTCFGIEGAE